MKKLLTILLTVLLLISNEALWASDIAPPKVTSWKLLNMVGDITSSSAKFQAELTVEDESEFDDPYLQLLPTNSTQFSDFASLEVISQTAKSKTYRATIVIPITAITGIWKWSIRPLSDRNRNSTIGSSVFASSVDFSNNSSVEVVSATSIAKAAAELKAKQEADAKAVADKAAADAKAVADKAAADAKAIADKAAADAKAIADKAAADKAAADAKAAAEANRKEQLISANPLRTGVVPLSSSGLPIQVKSTSSLSVFAYNSTNEVCVYENGMIKTKTSGRCVIAFSQEGNFEFKPATNLILDFTISAATKKTTITCIKGKLVKKVTAVKPVCPAGYKKK